MFTSMKDAIARHVAASGMARRLTANRVLRAAEQVISEAMEKKSGTPVVVCGQYYKQGVVYVTVASGIIAEEARFSESELVEKMNAQLGDGNVKRLRVFVGPSR